MNLFFQAIFILGIINYKNVTYGNYKYPDWAHAMGWSITASTLICIPVYAVFNIFRNEGESFMDVRLKLGS